MRHTEELVFTGSEDDFRLDGVVVRPGATPAKPLVVVCVPGLYATFYDSPYVALGRALARHGYTYLVGNNRGHDFGAVLRRGDGVVSCGGGGWERFEESPRDVGAWVSFAASLGFAHVALLGHSYGARKVAYYQAQRQDARVAGLIAASPRVYFEEPTPEMRQLFSVAGQMVAEGRGRDLVGWPEVGCSMSAQTFLEHEDRQAVAQNIYDSSTGGEPVVAKVQCPILAFMGGAEGDRAGELATIRRNATAASRVDTLVIEQADHNYTAREREVAAAIADWLDSLL